MPNVPKTYRQDDIYPQDLPSNLGRKWHCPLCRAGFAAAKGRLIREIVLNKAPTIRRRKSRR